jgi:hypothetical protein
VDAPFPWFGGKRRVAALVWEKFGAVHNYVEPFFGSGAVLLNRPAPWTGVETINDRDALVVNFWRAVQGAPDTVAHYADHPVFESDLHARHISIVQRLPLLCPRLEGDPLWYDAQIAGWWVWGLCCWIGNGWCAENGAWHSIDGVMTKTHNKIDGVERGRPRLRYYGCGINARSIVRKRISLGRGGRGVVRQLPRVGDGGQGIAGREVRCQSSVRTKQLIYSWFIDLSNRLRHVRVCSGDWTRVCGDSVTIHNGLTGVFLDPPYSNVAHRTVDLYREDSFAVAEAVRAWAISHGDHPLMRIALCGHVGEHVMPDNWTRMAWHKRPGYAARNKDFLRVSAASEEEIWFSPHCQGEAKQLRLFDRKNDESMVQRAQQLRGRVAAQSAGGGSDKSRDDR